MQLIYRNVNFPCLRNCIQPIEEPAIFATVSIFAPSEIFDPIL
jgi:hypothetical protein